jgi:hypothetical protein
MPKKMFDFYDSRPEPVNLQQKLAHFSDYWSAKLVGELNGQHD